ncbi:MAG TPA: DUF6599 family protein [Candidatus Sulfotelmatobacter sp.]|nr:DUF6599 family protein [Candidatus Sulfotelmatobacter sp.]
MNLSRPVQFWLSIILAFSSVLAWGAAAPAASPAVPAILPQQFGGWQMQGTAQTSNNPAVADPTNAAVLEEYRFTDLASAVYTRDDGRTLKVRAARFADASGAFGAYTFYLQPEMTREQIGDQGASLGQRVLFYRGSVLVDVSFSSESAMAGAELRELAGVLPKPSGNAGNLPSFIEFMPHRGYVANTQKYAMGPAALAALAPPVSADLVDFGASAEVSLGRYSTPSGEATLMLISYPTPQLAAAHLRRIDTAHQLAQPQSGISTIQSSGPFFDKRTGPIVAIATGPISESDAKSLLGMVNYEASVTWNQATDQHEVHDLYMLVLNVVILCAILGGLAIVAGVAFGGFRILMKRWFPEKVFDRPEQMEFISLHLTETVIERASQSGKEESRRVS